MAATQLQIGVVGLGRAFTMMLATFMQDSRVRLVGAVDPLSAARSRFELDFGAPAYASIEQLCAESGAQVIYVASPHQFHADHVCIAASFGKHVLVEKPMAISLQECSRMIAAVRSAGTHLLVGPSHSFDGPIQQARQLIDGGRYGAVKMIHAFNFTDFLYRPRRPEELNTRAGGGVVFSQAAHQMDIVRLLGGGLVRSVRAHTGAWDPQRPTEGAYSVLLGFEGGAFCSATYSGYGRYDSDVLMDGIGETGRVKDPADYGAARQRLRNVATEAQETALKAARNYGGSLYSAPKDPNGATFHEHFGHLVVSCENADLRPTAKGVEVYSDASRDFVVLPPPQVPRAEVMDELLAAVLDGKPPLHSGEWARATTEVCLAMLDSARSGKELTLRYQVAAARSAPR